MTLRGVALSSETRIAASPLWLRLVDTFTGRGPLGPVELTVELQTATGWDQVVVPFQVKGSGDLAFVDLGRVPRGQGGGQLRLRIAVTATGTITETPAGLPTAEVIVTTWPPDTPPSRPPVQEIRCYPAPDYRYGPSVPLLSGTVVQGGEPVGRARVRATETVAGNALVEEVRTNDRGWFRLPLRWSAGSTEVRADRAGANGSITIDVPDDLGSVVQLTLT